MKKPFSETLNVPLSPLFLPPFHISRAKKKTLTSTPLPLNSKKKRRKKINLHPFKFPPHTITYTI